MARRPQSAETHVLHVVRRFNSREQSEEQGGPRGGYGIDLAATGVKLNPWLGLIGL